MIFNTNWDGYYKVNYDAKNWEMIAEVLLEDHTRISVQNRGQILDAAFEMQRSNRIDFNLCRKIYSYLKKE